MGSSRISDLRVAHVGPRQRHLLPLAARQLDAAVEAAAEHLVVPLPSRPRDGVGQAAARGLAHPRPSSSSALDLADADVLLQDEVVAHEVLEDHADVAAQTVQVVVAQVHAVEQDAPLVGIVEAGEQLDERRLARPVLPDQRDALFGLELEAQVAHRPAARARVVEAHVVETRSPSRIGTGTGRASGLRSRRAACTSKNVNRSDR